MKQIISIFIITILMIVSISGAHAQKEVNSWDIGFESDYYDKYVTSQVVSRIPVAIDYGKREHTFEFFIDNINDRGLLSYQQISEDENNSLVTLHLSGEHNNLARIISPQNYDPRFLYSINYNTKRRIVVNFVMPSDFSQDDTFEIGLRARTIQGENRQILLNLMSEYPNTQEQESSTSMQLDIILIISGIVIAVVFIVWFFFLRRKGGFDNENF